MVGARAQTESLLREPVFAGTGLALERVDAAQGAIARVEAGELVDVILLAERLEDPVRVAQRLHSLDRGGAVVVLTSAEAEADVRHALEVAPFLSGDVSLALAGDAAALAAALGQAAARTRVRREAAAAAQQRRATPPPLSASYLGTLLDSVPIGLVTLDGGGCVIGWNRRAGDMLGVPEVEALGKSFGSFFSERDGARIDRLIDRLGGSGIEDARDVVARAERIFQIGGARFSIRSGETGTLLILQDVTERERAVHELRLQQVLSDAQAETSESGIVVLTLDGHLARANRRFSEIWGISEQDLRAGDADTRSRLMEMVEDPQALIGGLQALAESPDGEYRDQLRLKDGRIIERFAANAHDDRGNLIARIWFHTDVTARKREEDSLRFLAAASELLSASLEYGATLQRVADLAVPKIADWCTVDVLEDDGVRHSVAVAGPAGGELAPVADPEDSRVINAPIRVRERVFGELSLIRGSLSQPFDADDIQLAEELARRAAIAIDNSRIHAQLRTTARTLQEGLLPPHLPSVPGMALAARFRPAGAGMQVGGDFYDIFETVPGVWVIAVGDVCGKGAEAAALTALTRYTVRTAAIYEQSAGGVLGVLNEALLRQRNDLRFTTLAVCLLDLSDRSLRVACGGHPRPLLLHRDGSAEPIGAQGPLLGVIRGAGFPEDSLRLADGDVMVLYTDGLTDALAPEAMLDEDDLAAALRDCLGMSPAQITERLELTALAGDPERTPRDDIALVVAQLV